MPVVDTDFMGDFIENVPDMVYAFKEQMGNIMKGTLLPEVFAEQGPETVNTDPLNPGGVNPRWADLSQITIMLKGSSGILFDTGHLRATSEWRIEDSDFDTYKQVVKFGWFEGAGDRAWIAAIHEFGLNGKVFNTPEGIIMGGAPIGRTPDARRKIRNWFRWRLGIHVSGIIHIPERSMLRKTADLLESQMEGLLDIAILQQLQNIGAPT